MAWSNLFAGVQMKCVVGNVAIDVTKKVSVGRDTKAGRPILPFDCETTSCIDIGEWAYRAFICVDMTVTPNSNPVTCAGPKDARRQKNKRNLLHGNNFST
jgi:hypothetical protein